MCSDNRQDVLVLRQHEREVFFAVDPEYHPDLVVIYSRGEEYLDTLGCGGFSQWEKSLDSFIFLTGSFSASQKAKSGISSTMKESLDKILQNLFKEIDKEHKKIYLVALRIFKNVKAKYIEKNLLESKENNVHFSDHKISRSRKLRRYGKLSVMQGKQDI